VNGVPATGAGRAPASAQSAPVDDACALVTGASRGIGAAVAHQLAAAGWPVAVNYRQDREGAERVVGEIEDAGGRALAVEGDVSDAATPQLLVERLDPALGRVLVLVNNAGTTADDLSLRMKDADWQRVIDTNLTSAFRLTRQVLRGMVRARFGRIVNVASVVGQRANAGQANYAAAKAGLVGMTKSVAVEVARRGVTVNAVAPGFIDTEMTAGVTDAVTEAIPARRAGDPAEVAACVRFLCSAEASYVTGAVLTVDGGMSA
jgi:3-oxoacyl-[acyl-carrier protein] reductase